jgi:hypothetical protein
MRRLSCRMLLHTSQWDPSMASPLAFLRLAHNILKIIILLLKIIILLLLNIIILLLLHIILLLLYLMLSPRFG